MIKKTRKRISPISLDQPFEYRNLGLLTRFIGEYGKILPRRQTKLTVKQQKQLKKAIKQARILNLLPFVVKNK